MVSLPDVQPAVWGRLVFAAGSPHSAKALKSTFTFSVQCICVLWVLHAWSTGLCKRLGEERGRQLGLKPAVQQWCMARPLVRGHATKRVAVSRGFWARASCSLGWGGGVYT